MRFMSSTLKHSWLGTTRRGISLNINNFYAGNQRWLLVHGNPDRCQQNAQDQFVIAFSVICWDIALHFGYGNC